MADTLTREDPVTTKEQVEAVTPGADRDAADAKAWESITGQTPGENDIPKPDFERLESEGKVEAGEQPRGTDGKFAKRESTEAESSPEESASADKSGTDDDAAGATQKPSTKKDDKKEEAKPLDRDGRRKLLAAQEIVARVLGYDDEQIDAMQPKDLIELGQRLKPTFQAFEAMKKDLQKWKERARGQKAPDADTPDDGPGRTGDPMDKADKDRAEPDSGGVDSVLRDYLDPETFAEVKKAQRAERTKFQDQVAAANERAESAETQMRLDRLEVARDRLSEEFPQLKEDSRYAQILEQMDEMDPHGEYAKRDLQSFVKFMRRVARAEFFEDVERTTRHRLITGNRKDARSQPETTSHGSQPTAMTWDEFDNYAAWASVEANGNSAKMDQLMSRVKRPTKPRS